jgi:cytochrome c oxidase subunit 2
VEVAGDAAARVKVQGVAVQQMEPGHWRLAFQLAPAAEGGKLGRADVRFVTADNPLGVNPYDPNSRGNLIVTSGDLHLRVNKPVKVLLRSIDVIHNFYIPEFRAKMDMLPGSESFFWVTPTKTGIYPILCAAFCGVGHSGMAGNVVVESDEDYDKWIAQQQSFSAMNAAPGIFRAASQR